MDTDEVVLCAYHRAIRRERERTGVSWPLVRTSCIDEEDGLIHATGSQEIVATFTFDSLDRVRVRLV